VSETVLGWCNNNTIHIGINSTPVIDRAMGRLFVVTYTAEGGNPTYRLHALNLTTLADMVAPPIVTASHTLNNGTTYTFQPGKNRQRAALLEANGKVYVAFSSFCDFFADVSRGWVLGWNATSLTALTTNQLNDKLATSTTNYFLSSVWMAGSGPALAADGSIFFSTGNSDPDNSYDSANNLSESVVHLSGDLSRVIDFFTPSNVAPLEEFDFDLSSAGVLLLPPQSGSVPNLVVALSKLGVMFLLNQQNLGHFTPNGPDKVLGSYTMSQCWCVASYFKGSDGIARIATSAGNNIIIWKLQTSPTPALVQERSLASISTGQDEGFFTTVSSNGTQAGTAVIWAVSRPIDTNPAKVLLYAFDPATGSLLYSASAGTWPAPGDANIVPVVANGQVYVASTNQLAIFGRTTAPAAPAATLATQALSITTKAVTQTPGGGNQVTGKVLSVNGAQIIIQQRSGAHVTVDAKPAQDAFQSVRITKGEIVTAEGNLDALGILHARTIVRAKPSPKLWPPDQ
jgi:hypothetical protein